MHNRGFTLIELSIVLVILGLIVGGIVGGKALIHQAELNKLIADFHGYETAFNTYSLQYDAFPGDHAEAEEYWPGQTENGNGDGHLWDSSPANGQAQFEDQKVFDHMALAELIAFKPQGYAVSRDQVVGVHLPKGPLEGQGYRIQSTYGGAGGNPLTNCYGKLGTFLVAGSMRGDPWDLYGPTLSPGDARNVDTKIDDGIPTRGQLVGDDLGKPEYPYGGCVQGKTDTGYAENGETPDTGTNRYNVANTTIQCTMLYWLK